MTRTARTLLFAASAVAALACAAGAASAQTYDRVVVFGDSLSDNGNLYRATNNTNPPSPPYFQGRFSNGPTFIEVLFPNQNRFGTATGSVNNAFGGARTDTQANPPSLPIQLQGYRAAGGQFGPRDLVSILGGANNILQGIPGAAANPVTAQTVIGGIATSAATDVANLTRTIAGLGAGTIVVSNLPNIGATPQLAGPAAPLGTFATDTFNGALLTQLRGVADQTGGNIIYADINRAGEYLRANAAFYGFTNITQTCLNAATGAVCANPDQYLYFDGVHPTAAVHRLLAAVVDDYISYGSLGAVTAVQAETGLEHRRRAMDAALNRSPVAMPLGERESRLIATLEGGLAESDARGDVTEAEIDTLTARVAVEAGLSADLLGGLAFGYTRSDTDAGALDFETLSISGDAYGTWRRGALFVDAGLGGSFEEYRDIARQTSLAGAVHRADTDGWTFGAGARAGLIHDFGGMSVSPRVGLDYTTAQVEGYAEDGPVARQLLDERRVDALAAQASVRLDTRLGEGLDLFVEGGYRGYLSYDGDPVSVSLVDNSADRLLIDVEEPDDGVGLIDAGLSGRVGERWTISAAYRGRFGDGYTSNTGRLSVGYSF